MKRRFILTGQRFVNSLNCKKLIKIKIEIKSEMKETQYFYFCLVLASFSIVKIIDFNTWNHFGAFVLNFSTVENDWDTKSTNFLQNVNRLIFIKISHA